MSEKIYHKNIVCAENISFSAIVNVFSNDTKNYDNLSFIKRLSFETTHSHPYNELFVCFDSGITITTPERNIYLKAGEILLVPPGTVHTKLPGGSKWTSVGFSYTNIHTAKNHNLYSLIDNLCRGSSPKILPENPQIYTELYNLFYKSDIGMPSVCIVLRILEILIRAAENFRPKNKSRNICHKNIDITRITQLENIIENRFAENISCASVAKELFISERQLARILTKNFGMTLHEIITSRRIAMACKLLQNTDITVEKICYETGFNNKSVFYSSFKKITGMTPSQYRKYSGGAKI